MVRVECEVTMTYGFLFAFGPISSPITYVVLGFIAVLLFGNQLPSIMRSLGRGMGEIKKEVADIEGEIDKAVHSVEDKVKTNGEDFET